MDTRRLEAEVLSLPRAERARIAELLIASLDEDAEIERAWDVEVARRWAEIESGTVKTVPGEVALAKIRSLLR
jgi:putative addiction module component (TIGR02574 family)